MNLIIRSVALVVLTVIGISFFLPERLVAASENETVRTVRTLVAKIKSGSPGAARDELGTQLVDILSNGSERDVFDPQVVDDIASLLSDDDEVLKF